MSVATTMSDVLGPDDRAVVLFGAGGHARSVADVLARLGVGIACTVDPSAGAWTGVPMLREDDEGVEYARRHGVAVVLGFGGTAGRLRLLRRLQEVGLRLPVVVATTATVGADATIGDATVIFEHAHIGPAAAVGPAVVVNTHVVVEHDCDVGAGAFLSSAAVVTGGGRVGSCTMVGAGAVVLPYRCVGADCRVGAGAVVTRNIDDGETVVGVPAAVAGDAAGTEVA